MTRYLKITLDDGTRFILRVIRETPAFVRGVEVNAEGDEVVPPGAHQRLRIIDRGRIARSTPMRMNPKYATLEVAPRGEAGARKKTPKQLEAEIAEILRTRHGAGATRKQIPDDVRGALTEHAREFIAGSYRRYQAVGGKEPCVTVGLVTDYLRQAHMPEDFRWATKDQQRTWTRSVLESLRRRGEIGSSFGATARCYEPK